VSSIRETEMSPDLGLVRTGPCSKFNVGKNTSSRATIQAVFFGSFLKAASQRN